MANLAAMILEYRAAISDLKAENSTLRATNERMREALEKIAHSSGHIAGVLCPLSDPYYICREVARQALKEGL